MRTDQTLLGHLLAITTKAPQSINNAGSASDRSSGSSAQVIEREPPTPPIKHQPNSTGFDRRTGQDRRQGGDRRENQDSGLFNTRSGQERRKMGRRHRDYTETISVKV